MRRLDIAGRVGYLLATHDAFRRVLILTGALQLVCCLAIAAAPPAGASTLAVALTWTGLHDSAGVPLGAYYLSVVDTTEAITNGGPDLSLDPHSWAQWTSHALTTAASHQIVVSALEFEAGAYLFMMGLALWLLRFALSSTWLAWLATWFRPLFATMNHILADLYAFPICLTLALGVGAYHIVWHGRRGFGWGIILSSFAIGLIAMVLTSDPLTELYSDNGLLNQGRNLGFALAQAAVTNGPLTAGASPAAQLDTLTAQIIDACVRQPFQLWNFGTVVDGVGGCGPAWSAAIRTQRPDGPAHAMPGCGAPQALSYAQQLDMGNAVLGLVYCLLGAVFAVFVLYVAYSYVLVAAKAFLNAFLAVPAAMAAMIYGRPRQRGWRRLTLLFKHAMLVFAYVTYISIASLIVAKIAGPGGYADQVGMTHPLARLVMIAAGAALAIGLFRWLKRELGDHSHEELVGGLRDIHHRAHEGYERGRDAADKAQNRWNDWTSRQSGDDQTAENDQPLTGNPAPGRSQFSGFRDSRQPNDGPAPGRSPTPPAPTGPGGAEGAAGDEEATAAAEAGAAVFAPEILIPAAVAAVAQYRRRESRPHDSTAARHNATPPPVFTADADGPHPVQGRIGGSGNRGPDTRHADDSSGRPPQRPPDHPESPDDSNDDPPLRGRQSMEPLGSPPSRRGSTRA